MKILEVYLEGYNRLKLNKVNSIKITASELIQLIIGTNGSGKSSLQEQINCWVRVDAVDKSGTLQVLVSQQVDTAESSVKARLQRLVGHMTHSDIIGDVESDMALALA